ncbi:MAG: hypothetical protein ACD_2C00073G0008 [uncultured bacterium (gcode 4)]|uniref:Uncharacterized protein n=1 Tax=uncultured bacterium (gcode 4) TaxID=1234023 RepID=K2H250_9BACT|nr:MAG: hypothetical protein ACD_2C00073G0008 [uncultured bacterium (gcode 4)]
MNLVITCIAWVESLIKNEVERLGYRISEVKDRLVCLETDDAWIARVNLWSRVGNKVYLELAKKQIYDFDTLFDIVDDIDWREYVDWWAPVIVNAVSIKSQLTSLPAIQKTVKKAIVTNVLWNKTDILLEDPKVTPVEILVFIQDDECRVLLNTSWDALHKRGYRTSEHEAPIKESLAAALVLLSGWSYKKPLYDFFCGSWTILIEAALIARNIAPGSLWRRFSFEQFSWYPKKYLIEAREEAKQKSFADKKYEIYWSDLEEYNIRMAKANAENAKVLDTINFTVKDASEYEKKLDLAWTVISNPPYGLRLNKSNTADIYKIIAWIFRLNSGLNGGVITSYEDFDEMLKMSEWKKRKLYNGNERCYFYKKVA